jgi:hypothetical protein
MVELSYSDDLSLTVDPLFRTIGLRQPISPLGRFIIDDRFPLFDDLSFDDQCRVEYSSFYRGIYCQTYTRTIRFFSPSSVHPLCIIHP